MRLRLPFSLRSVLLACSALFSTVASASVSDGNLGNVMYVGDSITHGVNSGSWRWAMHKIFADNGISYTEKGIMTGNYSGGVAAGTSYGGRIFQNLHSSAASARTYEIAGRANSSSYGDVVSKRERAKDCAWTVSEYGTYAWNVPVYGNMIRNRRADL